MGSWQVLCNCVLLSPGQPGTLPGPSDLPQPLEGPDLGSFPRTPSHKAPALGTRQTKSGGPPPPGPCPPHAPSRQRLLHLPTQVRLKDRLAGWLPPKGAHVHVVLVLECSSRALRDHCPAQTGPAHLPPGLGPHSPSSCTSLCHVGVGCRPSGHIPTGLTAPPARTPWDPSLLLASCPRSASVH